MNKTDVIEKLKEETGLSQAKCEILNGILEDNFIIGRNNKEKIVNEICEKLNVQKDEADELYNKCMGTIVGGIFKRH